MLSWESKVAEALALFNSGLQQSGVMHKVGVCAERAVWPITAETAAEARELTVFQPALKYVSAQELTSDPVIKRFLELSPFFLVRRLGVGRGGGLSLISPPPSH